MLTAPKGLYTLACLGLDRLGKVRLGIVVFTRFTCDHGRSHCSKAGQCK